MNSDFYPIMLNIKNKKIAIIGGGNIAYRKLKKLVDYDANITLIAPNINEEIYKYKDKISIIKDKYKKTYILNSFLVIAATDDKVLNQKISNDCKDENILFNNISDMYSDFIVPSSIKRGDLTISISTNGKSPSLAKKIRLEIEGKYNEEYILRLNLLGDIRELVKEKCDDENKKKEILKQIINLSIDDLKERKKLYENKDRIQR
ncbi:MAG: precorrin-2 dehydrogenase/sirohydrochlorin ferrochelatase family protein [Senegalia sp. (in: firmicutes)]|uniref:precorrin-2 dehydrogenase/sirohydrochlorin ferrochelatase family protein n=1 Tax=Senegalia sp. (in: firmicutes) TaxID=1924098 RepID=UPI003F9D5F5B